MNISRSKSFEFNRYAPAFRWRIPMLHAKIDLSSAISNDRMSDAVPYFSWKAPFVAMAAFVISPPAAGEPVGRVTGIGGIFFKSEDPKALMAWYQDALGIKVEAWGGAMLSYDVPDHPPVLTLNAFQRNTDYMAPSAREFMLNFAVDDLDAMLRRLEAKHVAILKRNDSDPSGKFAWIMDPDGTKIELWQPLAKN